MKNISFKRIFAATAIVAFVCALSFRLWALDSFALPSSASDAKFNVTRAYGTPLTMPTTSVSNNFMSNFFVLEYNQPLSVWWAIQGSNGSASNVILTLRLSYGSSSFTNNATTPVLTCTNTANGTNIINQVFYFTAAQLLGARSIVPWQVSNTNTNVVNIGAPVFTQFRNLQQ